MALVALLAFPGVTLVASNVAGAEASTQCTPVQPATSGVVVPTGTSAVAFTYDKCTGLYVSAHYIYNPSTQTYSPLPGSEPTYACDTTTWQWQETSWQYISSQNGYVQQTYNVASVPAGNGTCTKPAPETAAAPAAATTAAQPNNSGGTSSVSAADTNTSSVNNGTAVTLTNNIGSIATSGDISVTQNTSAGNATSGDALASATVINAVNSVTGLPSGPVASFTKNIDGNVNGDIIISASELQPSNISLDNSNNLSINSKASGTINNNLDLSAKSGDVTASENTKVGNATSGNAVAMANIINMLNSYISAGQSFIGTININGNLNGNILMPPTFLSALAASGVPHTTINLANTNTTNISNSQAAAIMNQVASSAMSGQATSSQNTSTGDVTSGDARTSVQIYNLTGQQIIGTNGLLVMVNVMGKWVGVIVGAPSGSRMALLGGSVNSNNSNTLNLSTSTKNAINNNINLAAVSGNVNTTRNTVAGNATSGDASTSANIANFSNDSLSFGGWFGILFINVLGNWYGNFGQVAVAPITSTAPKEGAALAGAKAFRPIFRFVPKTGLVNNSAQNYMSPSLSSNRGAVKLASENTSKTLAASTVSPFQEKLIQSDKMSQAKSPLTKWLIIGGSLVLAGGLFTASLRRQKG